jgi:hypothetical protein
MNCGVLKVYRAFGRFLLVKPFIIYKEFDKKRYTFSIAWISNGTLEALVIVMCITISGG